MTDLGFLDAAMTVAARAVGVHTRRVDSSSLPPLARIAARIEGADAGIAAMEYYAPLLCIRATDVELFHGSVGRYTVGRG